MQVAHEPHKIKTVRPVAFPDQLTRKRLLASAGFNLFKLTPSQVGFEMCSTGTSAMSQEQLAGQLIGDEAYAGSRNFEHLEAAVRSVLGFSYICPAHNDRGATKLVVSALLPPGSLVPCNAGSRIDLLEPRGIAVADVRDSNDALFSGNVDLVALGELLEAGNVSAIGIQCCADGRHPFSIANLRAVRALADRHGKKLIVDGSRIAANAWWAQRHEPGRGSWSIAALVREIAKTAHVFQIDASQDAKCPSGALLATDNPADHERFMNDVVVFEGLHTYGGMSGRAMELFARGLEEMCKEDEVEWAMDQSQRLCARLESHGVPFEAGCDGAYLQADRFLPHLGEHQQDALSAALYQVCGIRAWAPGRVGHEHLVPVQIPRLAMTNRQLELVAEAIAHLYRQRDRVSPLELVESDQWRDRLRYCSAFADLEPFELGVYPFVIHTIEGIGRLGRDERQRAMSVAGYNTFLLRSSEVSIDLLTDSGTSAMSTEQWGAYDRARATPCTSDESLLLTERLEQITGYRFLIPTHQGRAAEQILSEIMIKPGQFVPGNMYFTTTKLHQELAGGIFADVIVDAAHDPEDDFPWKGNIDLAKLDALVVEHGAEAIAYVSFEHSVNMAGGQPVSMDNMREVSAYCSAREIPIFFDATRIAENAVMIQQRDPRYSETPVADILREMLRYGDGCTVSGKKDFLINIGGLLAFKDNERWARLAEDKLRIYEGGVADGGLAACDLAAIAQGVVEMLDDRYINARVMQTGALAQMLEDAGVPIVRPPGSHAVFLDARRFLPHLDQDEYPAQRLAAEIYIDSGIRAMERGNVSKGRDPHSGENYRPALELVRLTIPRRVYTLDHMRAVADAVIRVHERRHQIGGLRFVYEPDKLRFFQGRFEPLEVDGEAKRAKSVEEALATSV